MIEITQISLYTRTAKPNIVVSGATYKDALENLINALNEDEIDTIDSILEFSGEEE